MDFAAVTCCGLFLFRLKPFVTFKLSTAVLARMSLDDYQRPRLFALLFLFLFNEKSSCFLTETATGYEMLLFQTSDYKTSVEVFLQEKEMKFDSIFKWNLSD